MDFATVLRKSLPWITAAATSNVPALITMAAQAVGEVLGVDVPANGDGITTAVANATPEQLISLRSREMDFKEKMLALGFQQERDLRALDLEETKAVLVDVQNARNRQLTLGDHMPQIIFFLMLGAQLSLMALFIFGKMPVDEYTRALITTAFGAVNSGFVGAIAYFIGSSRGSKQSGDAVRRIAEQQTPPTL